MEQLALIPALESAAGGTWREPVPGQFLSCSTRKGWPRVQLSRGVRGTATRDGHAAARSVRSLLTDRGYDAEVRDVTNVVAVGPGGRYANFNSEHGLSIMHIVSFCYPFDIDHDTPTVPPWVPSPSPSSYRSAP